MPWPKDVSFQDMCMFCVRHKTTYLFVLVLLSDAGQFKCMLFRMTALLVTSKDADRRLLRHLCLAPVRLFDESVMESVVACWEWLLVARCDLRVQVSCPVTMSTTLAMLAIFWNLIVPPGFFT